MPAPTEDAIAIEILANGDIKVTTDPISPANHLNADQFLTFLATLAGGETTKAKNRRGHTHTHQHDHVQREQ